MIIWPGSGSFSQDGRLVGCYGEGCYGSMIIHFKTIRWGFIQSMLKETTSNELFAVWVIQAQIEVVCSLLLFSLLWSARVERTETLSAPITTWPASEYRPKPIRVCWPSGPKDIYGGHLLRAGGNHHTEFVSHNDAAVNQTRLLVRWPC